MKKWKLGRSDDFWDLFKVNLNGDNVTLIESGGKIEGFDFPGIYACICADNEKIYIGSSVDVSYRVNRHIQDMKVGKHHNSLIQNSFNKHGADGFVWFLLERFDNEGACKTTEQTYFDYFQPFSPEHFNIEKSAFVSYGVNYEGREKRTINFVSPEGKVFEVDNVNSFVRSIKEKPEGFRSLAGGYLHSYKGWTIEGSSFPVREWEVVSPTGELHKFTHFKNFCKEQGMSIAFSLLLNHKKEIFKGWTLPEWRKTPKVPEVFISPEGKEYPAVNVLHIPRVENISYISLKRLLSGKRDKIKGWTMKK